MFASALSLALPQQLQQFVPLLLLVRAERDQRVHVPVIVLRAAASVSSIRGRLGWSFDRAMLYITGGAAFRNSGSDEVIYAYNAAGVNVASYTANSGRNNVGWSLGGGLEWAFTNNVSLKLEYLHSQFNTGDGVYLTSASGYTGYAFRGDNNRDSVDVARLGINYRFGGPVSAPVLARY